MAIRYERKRLVVSAEMFFPYMDIEGVKNVPEEFKDLAGNDVIRVLYGELILTKEKVSPGDYIVRFDDGSIKAISHKDFSENYTKLSYVCQHCGKSEDAPVVETNAPDVIVNNLVKEQPENFVPQSSQKEPPRHPLAPPPRRR